MKKDEKSNGRSEVRIGESHWLVGRESWHLQGVDYLNIATFLLNLPMLVGEDAILHSEGCEPPNYPILVLMDSRRPEKITEFEDCSTGCVHHHMQTTHENMDALARLSSEYNFFLSADHFHIYKGMDMLLEAWDNGDAGWYVTKDITEDAIKEFCKTVGCQYERFMKNEDGDWVLV